MDKKNNEETRVRIKATNVTRRYGNFTAVDGASFSIPAGQVVGLLGHNGAGKSTMLKMLTGYLAPSEGSIYIDGVEVDADRLRAQQRIGYLPENCPLYPDMTVVDYLHYICRLRALPESKHKQAIARAVAETRLGEKAGSAIGTLSKGLRQRVGIAQAIIHEPDILILDEPTSGLDPEQIREIRALITSLGTRATVILSTHILQEVQAICDRAIVIMRGKIAKDALLEELRYSNQLRLAVIGGEGSLKQALESVSAVRSFRKEESRSELLEYVVEISGDPREASPEIARSVLEQGCGLIELHPERRDLETVFRELSRAEAGGEN